MSDRGSDAADVLQDASGAAAPGLRADAAAFLSLRDVGYRPPGGPWLVQGIGLQLARGELHCVVGRSGCGKTTLLKLAAGLLAPSTGDIRLQGRVPEALRAGIGFMFQAPTLLEWLTVRDNVLLPVALQRRARAADRERAQALLAQLGLADCGARRPRQLSGGQQSRVALARALMLAPSLLLLDEPFAALDAITREELQVDLQALCREHGTTMVFVTHDILEAVWLADRVSVMDRGRIVHQRAIDLPRPRQGWQRLQPALAAHCAALRAAMHLESGAAVAGAAPRPLELPA